MDCHGVEVILEPGRLQTINPEVSHNFSPGRKVIRPVIDCFHDPIMQHVLGGSLHKNNTSCLLLGLYHASVN